MSISNVTLIGDALRSINVISESEEPSPEQGAYCLRQLNQMLATWEVDHIPLGYFSQSDTSGTCPIPEWAEQGVTYKLAIRIAGHYGAEPTPSVLEAADSGHMTILRTVMNLQLEGADMRHLPAGSGKLYGDDYEIGTG